MAHRHPAPLPVVCLNDAFHRLSVFLLSVHLATYFVDETVVPFSMPGQIPFYCTLASTRWYRWNTIRVFNHHHRHHHCGHVLSCLDSFNFIAGWPLWIYEFHQQQQKRKLEIKHKLKHCLYQTIRYSQNWTKCSNPINTYQS